MRYIQSHIDFKQIDVRPIPSHHLLFLSLSLSSLIIYPRYTATGCKITTAHTEIRCKTTSGNGLGHSWTVSVTTGTQTRLSEASIDETSYHPPVLDGVSGANIEDLGTDGGQNIILTGKYFGTATLVGSENCEDSSRPTLEYGSPQSSTSAVKFGTKTRLTGVCCSVMSQTQIVCKSSAGVGQNFDFQVMRVYVYPNQPGSLFSVFLFSQVVRKRLLLVVELSKRGCYQVLTVMNLFRAGQSGGPVE